MNLAEAFRSTTVRWTVSLAAALLVQSAFLAGLFYALTARHATDEVDRALVDDCRSVKGLARQELRAEIKRRIGADVHRVQLVGLFDKDGRLLAGNIASVPRALSRSSGPIVVGLVRTEPPDPVPNNSRSMACRLGDGQLVVFARDTDQLDYISVLTLRALWLETIPALLLAGGLGLFLAQRAQKRFDRVKAAIDAVMAGDLGTRLPIRSRADPFERLSVAVNAMLDKLELAIADLRYLGDDIAHELRTPLTRLRARLERSCRDAVSQADFRVAGERAIRDIDHALSIVSAILRIRAIDEAKRGSEFKLVDLDVLLKDAVELYAPIAEEKHVTLSLEITRPARVTADGDLLMEAVCNLIDNAIKFTPEGGCVTCFLDIRAGDLPALRVLDNGLGIPAEERPAVTRRFHRGPYQGSTDGHGIGLSLVGAIVRLHGFELELGDAAPGCEVSIVCCRGSEPASEMT